MARRVRCKSSRIGTGKLVRPRRLLGTPAETETIHRALATTEAGRRTIHEFARWAHGRRSLRLGLVTDG